MHFLFGFQQLLGELGSFYFMPHILNKLCRLFGLVPFWLILNHTGILLYIKKQSFHIFFLENLPEVVVRFKVLNWLREGRTDGEHGFGLRWHLLELDLGG